MGEVQIAGVTLSDPKIDEASVQDAWGIIQDECLWHIAPTKQETITLSGSGDRELLLPTLKLVNLISVFIDGIDVTGEVEWREEGILRLGRHRRWPDKYSNVTVTMSHGYEKMPPGLIPLVRQRARAGVGGPKQLMSGGFLIINDQSGIDGVLGFNEAGLRRLDRYRLQYRIGG